MITWFQRNIDENRLFCFTAHVDKDKGICLLCLGFTDYISYPHLHQIAIDLSRKRVAVLCHLCERHAKHVIWGLLIYFVRLFSLILNEVIILLKFAAQRTGVLRIGFWGSKLLNSRLIQSRNTMTLFTRTPSCLIVRSFPSMDRKRNFLQQINKVQKEIHI